MKATATIEVEFDMEVTHDGENEINITGSQIISDWQIILEEKGNGN